MSVHPSAVISPGAQVADDCIIGPYTVIHEDVVVEAGCRIGPFCELGVLGPVPGVLQIGAGAVIRGHSVLYAGSVFGPGLETGHRVTLREGLTVGKSARIGTLSDLQGDTDIGDYFRCHSSVFVAKYSRIGHFVWLFPHAVLTNDPHPPSDVQEGVTVEDYAAVAAMSTVLSGVRIGREALVGAHTLVRQDVGPGRLCVGVPGRDVGPASSIRHRGLDVAAYPWRRHFTRGYPPEVADLWATEDPSVDGLSTTDV